MKAVSASILTLAGAVFASAGLVKHHDAYEAVGCVVGVVGLVSWLISFFFMKDIER